MRIGDRKSKGFTLIELLIVVIIIGILAAVAIPQFGGSSRDAKVAALDADLTAVRSSVEMYYVQHNSTYPGVVQTHKAGAGAAAAMTDAADAFVKQLTMYSDANGKTADTKDTTNFPFGPYLKKGIPANPLPAATATATPAAVTVGTDTGPIAAEASPATGWRFSSATGSFIANNPDYQTR